MAPASINLGSNRFPQPGSAGVPRTRPQHRHLHWLHQVRIREGPPAAIATPNWPHRADGNVNTYQNSRHSYSALCALP